MALFHVGTPGSKTPPMPSTLYIPRASPPTPAPSLGPFTDDNHDRNNLPLVRGFQQFTYNPTHDFSLLNGQACLKYLNKLIARCTPKDLSHISGLISPLLRRNFLQELPTELALQALSYVDNLHELVRGVGGVCKYWRRLSSKDCLWRRMCERWEFEVPLCLQESEGVAVSGSAKRDSKSHYLRCKSTVFIFSSLPHPSHSPVLGMSWIWGGTLLCIHQLQILQPKVGVVTSLAMDEDWIIVGLLDNKIHVFSSQTGVLSRTLVGCQEGVWAVWLVGKGLWSSPSLRKKNTNSGSAGWGQETSLVVSGGCNEVIWVWDVETGYGGGRKSL